MFGDTKMLKQHQKKTKYCLKIQEVQAKEAIAKATSELICQFCLNQFKTKYLLSRHQKQAKYCIKIQESQNHQEIIESFVNCKYCEKKFSSGNFNRHDSICKKKIQFLTHTIKDQEIARLKNEKDQEITRMKIEKEKDEKEITRIKIEKEKDEKEITRIKIEKR